MALGEEGGESGNGKGENGVRIPHLWPVAWPQGRQNTHHAGLVGTKEGRGRPSAIEAVIGMVMSGEGGERGGIRLWP